MKRFYIFKDGMQQGSTATRESAVDLIRLYQTRETHPILKAQFSIIAGEEEFIPYPHPAKKTKCMSLKAGTRQRFIQSRKQKEKNMDNTARTSINEAEELKALKALKALVGSRFAARNELAGSRGQFIYMAGDLVTLTDINIRKRRVCMCNKQGLTGDMNFEIFLELFQRDFDMVPVSETELETDTQEEAQEPQKAGTAETSKTGRQKPMTVSQELFKQLIFDTVMESQDQMSEDAVNALLDILNRYDIGSPWCSMADGKPASGKYFFIKLKQSAEYAEPYWEQPLFAMRMIGGFHAAGKPFGDEEVESYSEIHIPR